MSQRSIFDFGVSKKRRADDESTQNSENPATQKSKIDTASKSRVFQNCWLKQFDWLEYDSDSTHMFCKTCRAANIHNAFTKEGAG